jgi:hypothetical protein
LCNGHVNTNLQEIVTEDTTVKSNHFKASEDNPKVRVKSEKSGKEVRLEALRWLSIVLPTPLVAVTATQQAKPIGVACQRSPAATDVSLSVDSPMDRRILSRLLSYAACRASCQHLS